MFKLIYRKYGERLRVKDDLLSGLTVALALVPEAVAFAFVAGVDPLSGLYAAFFIGLITATIGGRPGMISGATGAIAIVVVSLVIEHGVQYLFPAVVLMGAIQVTVGLLRLGKFIRLVPHPVMLGFVNGLAIVIFMAQIPQFTVDPTDVHGAAWMQGGELFWMLGLVAVTMAVIHFLPKLTQAIPSSLVAIVGVTLAAFAVERFLNVEIRTVGDISSVGGGLPVFQLFSVPMTLETLWIILPYAFIMASVGLIESLMTMQLIDELTETRGQGNRECLGQGVANVVTGFFGGMGGCAMIGQSMINIRSGGRGRLSGISAALFLLIFILFASGLIEQISMAALTGVMMMVVLGTFEWASLRIFGKVPKEDIFVVVLVTLVTVFAHNLALAVAAGVVVSALVYAWKTAKQIWAEEKVSEEGSKIYLLHGPLFFASVQNFQDIFNPQEDPEDVIIDFKMSRVCDHSALEAIKVLAERYEKNGTKLHLRHLSNECRVLLDKAGDLVEVNVVEDPDYHVAV
ncbi:MAG: SulP family inorganic anion transporter [Opitutales bacterium]|nr:SulP family inorganic anion transporter [Opitutales bacterium]NRA25976.1 SulP family inorganic anion transporter [Opitutales bacterium]